MAETDDSEQVMSTSPARTGSWKKLPRLLAMTVACAMTIPLLAAPSEYEVKAVFVYKLLNYIRWPPPAEAGRPFVIGILGQDPFGKVIDDVVNGESINGRAVVVRRLPSVDDALHCDLVFVSSSERPNLPGIFKALRDAPVLTVGDMERFAESGGMINLTNVDRRIRFEVNVAAIDRGGLKAASQLLSLAKIVDTHASAGRQ